MHTNSTFVIFWEPPGATTQPGYERTITTYLADVAAASGAKDNVYATDEQYDDTTGPVRYSQTYAGSYIDRAPFPPNSTDVRCKTGPQFPVCLDRDQTWRELLRVVTQLGLPQDTEHAYFLVLPKEVRDVGSFVVYCAYHWNGLAGSTFVDGPLVGAVIFYDALPIPGATVDYICDQRATVTGVQGATGTDADAAINIMSHEHNEMITDPHLDAWFDRNLSENADKCDWTFGPRTLLPGNRSYNQIINGHPYLLQEEWSNVDRACRQGMTPNPA